MVTTRSSSTIVSAGRVLAEAEYTQFKQDGFLTISEIATLHDFEAVRKILDGLFRQAKRDYGVLDHALTHAPQLRDSTVFQSCERIAKQVLGPAAAVSFDQALYKPPHEDIGTRWHQDQAFQGKYRPMNTLHLWIPLQPVTELNGCLHFMPGSHHLGLLPHNQCRSDDVFSLIPGELPPLDIVCCPLPLGGATIHTPLTLHRALPNTTGSIRRAWALLFRNWGRWGHCNPFPVIKSMVRAFIT
jgi:Phytanoyl-CoA dioxygenase (PhyH)